MTKLKKQPKITKLFRRNGKHAPSVEKQPSDVQELQDEVQALERRLRERQTELFTLQRLALRHKTAPIRKKEETFVGPQKIMISNSVEHMKRDLQLLRMITGTEVTAYHAGDRCSVVFCMENNTHGLRILINPAPDENQISSSALPLGFNLEAVLEDYDNVMSPQCLGAVRKALVAYYNRLEQYQKLKKAVRLEAELFKTMDGSHIQITVNLKTADYDECDQFIKFVLMLDYRVSEIRPKSYTIQSAEDLPEGAAEILTNKCAVFKKKPLDVAFKEAFLSDIGPYQMMRQGSRSPRRPRPRRRPRPHKHTNNDDTFRPEECSDLSEDDDQ